MSETATHTHKHHHSRKDTFDQIMLMLMLAFAFKVFVLEAFVIPTGSMAPTLMGAHTRVTCRNCGYHYDVNYSATNDGYGGMNISADSRVAYTGLRCPNCGFTQDEEHPQVYYGDRILVLKYAYLVRQPQRWDVIVFKTPDQPAMYHYSQAYIKRLIGKPGEQVMILDGDVYIATVPNPADADWQIQEKPDYVQNALWRIVNDTDYAPLGLTPDDARAGETYSVEDYMPWKTADASWSMSRDSTGARVFNFRSPSSQGDLHFDYTVRKQAGWLTDFMAYDQYTVQPTRQPLEPVGDLKLSLYYTRSAGEGPLDLKLSKDHDLFTARITPTEVALYRSTIGNDAPPQLLCKASHTFGAKPAKIDFVNLDYRVHLNVDGNEVLSTTHAQYHPDVTALKNRKFQPPMPRVSIDAANQVCSLSHVSLWRDNYYTQTDVSGQPIRRGGPDSPVKLGAQEYFALGDNSPLSGDGRFWSNEVHLPAEDVEAQAGVVPERFLLGKAFVVYWPAGYRLVGGLPDLIPNFGDMRFIH